MNPSIIRVQKITARYVAAVEPNDGTGGPSLRGVCRAIALGVLQRLASASRRIAAGAAAGDCADRDA